jgi:pyridoxal phosphate enzyme (YggS family)
VSRDAMERNIQIVRRRLADALSRSGRAPDACRLLAVTKLRSVEEVEVLADLGQTDFGENRVPEALKKIPEVRADARWHLIGHLQRNKAKKALTLFDTVHSVDSLRLLSALGGLAESAGKTPEILLEVNVSGETQKHGLTPNEVAEVCRAANDQPSLRLTGLMTMAPIAEDPEDVRGVFRGLRELRDSLNDAGAYATPLAELSMGMTQDFEVAAEEGATWVRVGSALFETL